MTELSRHPHGFWEVQPKPSQAELDQFYNTRYYGHCGQYAYPYTDEERINKKVGAAEAAAISGRTAGSLLDLGCGEGFFLDYFAERGWQVTGADFTLDGIEQYFPHLADRVIKGNLFTTIEALQAAGQRYDLVTCNNVLEHVLDPLGFLGALPGLLNPGGVCRIVVPNDDSIVQRELVRRGLAQPDYWVCPPGHLSYFNGPSLANAIAASGLTLIKMLADFPIDFALFNPATNYQAEASLGRSCHFARVAVENLIASKGIAPLIAFREGCAAAGVGRVLIAYCTAADGKSGA